MPGGHRGGVLKFETLFKNNGIMSIDHIGNAVCRLIPAAGAVDLMKRYLSDDPAFVLDDNPYCEDCLRFRGLINAERLNKERFRLHVRLPYYAGMDLKRFMQLTKVLGLQGSRLIIRKLLLIMKLIKFSTQRMNIGLISRYYELALYHN